VWGGRGRYYRYFDARDASFDRDDVATSFSRSPPLQHTPATAVDDLVIQGRHLSRKKKRKRSKQGRQGKLIHETTTTVKGGCAGRCWGAISNSLEHEAPRHDEIDNARMFLC